MTDETKMIDVMMGPYRGHRLTVSAADAQSAIASHWASDADAPLPGPNPDPPPPLSDEERTAAWEAANEWARNTWAISQGEPAPVQGEAEARHMEADDAGRYTTRSHKPSSPRRR